MTYQSLYLHIPFCRRKCHYCDFLSFPLEQAPAEQLAAYPALLLEELRLWREAAAIGPLQTVYLGGGTPTLLGAAALGELLSGIDQLVGIADEAEISIEANPETIDTMLLHHLRAAGYNRLSLGVQSFQPDLLAAMGRLHTPAQAEEAVATATAAGFENIGLDLIYGLPGQTLAGWQADLATALRLPIRHLSLYGLTISGDCAWGRQGVEPLEEDLAADLLEEAMQRLPAAGFAHYEIANFAQPGFACRHNLVYWQRKNYLGLGPSAASCDGLRRFSNERDLAAYREALAAGRLPIAYQEDLGIEEIIAEAMFLGLRLRQGIDLAAFQQRYGVDPRRRYRKQLQKLTKLGLLQETETHLQLSERGLLLGNQVFEQFV